MLSLISLRSVFIYSYNLTLHKVLMIGKPGSFCDLQAEDYSTITQLGIHGWRFFLDFQMNGYRVVK